MHLKSFVIDSQVLRIKRQDNDSVVIRDARSITQLAEPFERQWALPGNKVWRPER